MMRDFDWKDPEPIDGTTWAEAGKKALDDALYKCAADRIMQEECDEVADEKYERAFKEVMKRFNRAQEDIIAKALMGRRRSNR